MRLVDHNTTNADDDVSPLSEVRGHLLFGDDTHTLPPGINRTGADPFLG